jgi:hypothetical protein
VSSTQTPPRRRQPAASCQLAHFGSVPFNKQRGLQILEYLFFNITFQLTIESRDSDCVRDLQ